MYWLCVHCRDLDLLIVPLLQQLYLASSRAPSQLYMLLIVILILSQDAAFAQNLHEITVPTVPWFKERLLQQTSLGVALHDESPPAPGLTLPRVHSVAKAVAALYRKLVLCPSEHWCT